MSDHYSYASSVKSRISDEFINTYFVRPLAGIVVRLLFSTSITPNQVTIASAVVGAVAAFFYLDGAASKNFLAGICIVFKDILDSADGQLARARRRYSRAGRFLDSIGDFFVNLFVFVAIGLALYRSSGALSHLALSAMAFLGTTLRVSYHVFYQTSFLHLEEKYDANRVTEEIRSEDLMEDRFTVRLQQVFQFLYGWQDRLMSRIDAWCRQGIEQTHSTDQRWLADKRGLRISGLLGLGTELFILMLFSVWDKLELYLMFNVLVLNAIWLASIMYRKQVLAERIKPSSTHSHSEGSP